MQGEADWRSAIAITCSLAVALAVVAWNMRKGASASKKTEKCKAEGAKETDRTNVTINCSSSASRDAVEEEPVNRLTELLDPRWVKVGQVQELYFYPLKSGRGKDLKECNFTEYGISVENEGRLTLRDRMFLVYNEETLKFQTSRQYPTLILVSISAVDEFKVKLEAVGMPSVVFDVPQNNKKSTENLECKVWWGEQVKCIDCGQEPAEWLSRFLTGTNSGLRLGCAVIERRQITQGLWDKFTSVYKTLRNEDTGLLSDVSSYMMMTAQSLKKLNEKLERPVPALQFRPNIFISGQDPFAEDNWEWIKIGESTILRNVKPCPRCKLSCVNPETGVMEKEEPLKTLKSFREQTDPERISVDGRAPTMGIYCGLYVSGKVRIGDDVFVHVPDNPAELNGGDDHSQTV